MTTCEGCGTENPPKKGFCKSCGRVLPVSDEPARNISFEDIQSSSMGDMFSGLFGGSQKPAEHTPEPERPESGGDNKGASSPDANKADAGSSGGAGQISSRAEALKLVAKAGARAIVKSVSLSLLVLGPGFAMLMMGITIPGMIWLFCGSFGLMAWTYRKPWRLGIISCLIPPVAAAAVYLIQLALFGATAPPIILLAPAIAIGIGVGYWRAQTHKVTQGEDGGIVAERTIGYLLVWVAAYAVTQTLGFVAAGTFAIRAGLITGAFSTAMLAMVSIVIWRQYTALRYAAIAVFGILSLMGTGTDRAVAQTKYDDAMRGEVLEIALQDIRPIAREVCEGARISEKFTKINTTKNVTLSCGETEIGFFHYIYSESDYARSEIVGKKDRKSESERRYYRSVDDYYYKIRQGLSVQKTWQTSSGGGEIFAVSGVTDQAKLIATSRHDFNHLRTGTYSVGDNLRGRISIEVKIVRPATRDRLQDLGAAQTAGHILNVVGPKIAQFMKSRIAAGTPPPPDPPPPPGEGITPEEAAAVSAAVATILIAAGVAVNVAQALAAAIANALQSGIQLTSEEIQRAVSEALLGAKSESAPGETGTEPPDPESNAPPNVTSTERVRPPTPIFQPDGTAFETNEDGQYWGPDENGDQRWLSSSEARESASAQQAEHQGRKGEIDEHDRETEDMLARSREQTTARHDAESEAEARAKDEQAARAAHSPEPDDEAKSVGRIYRDPAHATPGWDNTWAGWGVNFLGDFVGGSGKDAADLIVNAPGALADAAGAAGNALTNIDNWKAASEAGMYLTALQRGDVERLGKAGSTIAAVAQHVGEAVYNDPRGSAVAAADVILGGDNWRKATDPNVSVTERFGRAVWGVIDTGGTIAGLGGIALKGAGKINTLIRVGDTTGDLARGANVLDKAGDAATATKTVDKIGDAAGAAEKAGDTARAAEAVDKTSDGTRAAGRAARESKDAGRGGRETLNEMRDRLANQKQGPVANPKMGPNTETHGIPDMATDPGGYVKGLPEGALVDRNLASAGTGYTGHQIDDMARFAKQEGAIPGARTTNLDSMPHIRNGTAVPKDVNMKAKTIGELDTYLGAKPKDKGLVGYFKPKKPDLSKVPEQLRGKVTSRYTARLDEYNDLRSDITKMTTEGKIVEKDGKIFKVVREANGKTKHVPYAGDIDGVYFKDAKTGKLIPPGERYDRLKAAWMGGDESKGVPNHWTGSGAAGQHGVETNVVADLTEGLTPGTSAYDKAAAKAEKLHGKLAGGYPGEIVMEVDEYGNVSRGIHFSSENPMPNLAKAS